jgi:23S rRNA pseudouridine2457 synthase
MKEIEPDKERFFILYKPAGYLSQFKNNGPKKGRKKLLGAWGRFPDGTMAIGRLDEQSEGLLLLTTDGMTSHKICKGPVEKEYHAQLDGEITDDAIEALRQGVEIGIRGKRYQTQPCAVLKLHEGPPFPNTGRKIRGPRHGPTSWVSITLREGKYRQVRKMTAAVGFPTLRLLRVRIGEIHLSGMEPGDVLESENFLSTPGSVLALNTRALHVDLQSQYDLGLQE